MNNYKSEEEFLKNYNSDEFDKLSMTADILLIENKLAEIISRLSLNPTEKLEAEFQSLLAKKRLLLSKQSS